MIRHLIAGIKRGLGLHRPGRSLLILPDDIFLVSFPKSGNTWTRFLLANLVRPDTPATFANIHQLIPDPSGTSKREFSRVPRPRIIKSHDPFDPRFPRVIYIVRDPRDVALSQYHYHRMRKKLADESPVSEFVTRFIAGKTCPHGSWGENVLTWVATRRGDPRFLLLRYEDMVADTPRELRKIADFIGMSADSERIQRAVELSSVGHMRKLEQAQGEKSELIKGSRKDLNFVRAGKSGGWRSELPPSEAARIEAAWGPLMRYLGYELVSQAASQETPQFEPLAMLSTTR